MAAQVGRSVRAAARHRAIVRRAARARDWLHRIYWRRTRRAQRGEAALAAHLRGASSARACPTAACATMEGGGTAAALPLPEGVLLREDTTRGRHLVAHTPCSCQGRLAERFALVAKHEVK